MSTYMTNDLQVALVFVAGVSLVSYGLSDFLDQVKNKIPGVATKALVNVILGVLLLWFWYSVLFQPTGNNRGGYRN